MVQAGSNAPLVSVIQEWLIMAAKECLPFDIMAPVTANLNHARELCYSI